VELIKDKLRERFDDAKQAFHALDTDADGRLSEEEFVRGIKECGALRPADSSSRQLADGYSEPVYDEEAVRRYMNI
jgi:Ca2+-binding EF-hand superfamily protein